MVSDIFILFYLQKVWTHFGLFIIYFRFLIYFLSNIWQHCDDRQKLPAIKRAHKHVIDRISHCVRQTQKKQNKTKKPWYSLSETLSSKPIAYDTSAEICRTSSYRMKKNAISIEEVYAISLSTVVKFSQNHANNIHKSTRQSYHLAMVINENYNSNSIINSII